MTIETKYNERKKWFIDRVGKKVFRNKTSCTCGVCANVYENGLLITDEYHAIYIRDIEGEYNAEGEKLKYFDTIKERDSFEQDLLNSL